MIVVAELTGERVDLILHVGELLLNGEHILDRFGSGKHLKKPGLLRFIGFKAALHVVILHRHVLHVCVAVGNVAELGEGAGQHGELVARHTDEEGRIAPARIAAGDTIVVVAGNGRALHKAAQLFDKCADLLDRMLKLGRFERRVGAVDDLLAHVGDIGCRVSDIFLIEAAVLGGKIAETSGGTGGRRHRLRFHRRVRPCLLHGGAADSFAVARIGHARRFRSASGETERKHKRERQRKELRCPFHRVYLLQKFILCF